MLRGPTKVEYLFLEQLQDAKPPVNPSKTPRPAINAHFWDWIWWIASKTAAGRHDLVLEHLPRLFRHLLQPMGVATVARHFAAAIRAFVTRRDAPEREYGISIPRALENEIQRGVARIAHPS
jgi:hypothetical protein